MQPNGPVSNIIRELKQLDSLDRQTPQKSITKKRVGVSIISDEMEAYITLTPPLDENDKFTKQDIMESLANNGVVFGIQENTIDEIISRFTSTKQETLGTIMESKIYFTPILVAKGKPPEEFLEENKIIEQKNFTEITPQQYQQIIMETMQDGLSSFENLPQVTRDEMLVTAKASAPPEPGKTVAGKIVPPEPYIEPASMLQLIAGANTRLTDDETALVSNCDGLAVKVDGLISVIPYIQKKDWQFALKVEDNGLRAYVKAIPPPGELTLLPSDKEKLQDFIIKNGINTGLIEDYYQKVFQDFNSFVLAAEGALQIDGQDAQIHDVYLETNSTKISEDEKNLADDKVDYKQIRKYTGIREGNLIAVKIPPAKEINGISVYGKPIIAKTGKDVSFKAGKGTLLSEDGLSIIAAQGGIVQKRAGNVYSVINVLEINSNVDYSVGNIDFNGTVNIKGDVLPNFNVVANDDIIIRGNVEKALVSAGGALTIKGGIYKSGNTVIKSNEDMRIRSAENAKIECGENLFIDQYLMHSEVSVDCDTYVNHPSKGKIVGGKLILGGKLEAAEIGSKYATPTTIEIGLPPVIRNMLNQLKKEIEGMEIQKERMEMTIKKVVSKEIPVHSLITLNALWDTYFKLVDKIRKNDAKIKVIEEKFKDFTTGYVRVTGIIYPAVIIKGRWNTLKVSTEMSRVEFRETESDITITPFYNQLKK